MDLKNYKENLLNSSRVFILIIYFIPLSCLSQKDSKTHPLIENKVFELTLKSMLKFSVPVISVEDLNKDSDRFILLDAREKAEFDVSHLPGAIHIGYESVNWNLIDSIPKSDTLLLYCSIGYRSEKLAEQLASKGHPVVNLYGSIFEWANRGYPIVDNNGKKVNRIHGYNKIWSLFVKNKDLDIEY